MRTPMLLPTMMTILCPPILLLTYCPPPSFGSTDNMEHDRAWRMCVSVCEMLTLGISFTLAGVFNAATTNSIGYLVGGTTGWAFVGVYFVLAILITISAVPVSQTLAKVGVSILPCTHMLTPTRIHCPAMHAYADTHTHTANTQYTLSLAGRCTPRRTSRLSHRPWSLVSPMFFFEQSSAAVPEFLYPDGPLTSSLFRRPGAGKPPLLLLWFYILH
jgi:hypothetical protein